VLAQRTTRPKCSIKALSSPWACGTLVGQRCGDVLVRSARVSLTQSTITDPCAREQEHDRLTLLSYPGTDVLLVCFSLTNRRSFDRVKTRVRARSLLCCMRCRLLIGVEVVAARDHAALSRSAVRPRRQQARPALWRQRRQPKGPPDVGRTEDAAGLPPGGANTAPSTSTVHLTRTILKVMCGFS
jgi:hypothetical protein